MRLPTRWVRRAIFGPAVIALAMVVLAFVPLWLLVALAASPLVPGRLRALRVAWLAFVYLLLEALGLTIMFGLWIASGLGWRIYAPPFQRAHYRLAGMFLRTLFWQARWVLRLQIDIDGPDPDTAAPGRPILVLCRHAGPGDSFTITHALINWYEREPRIVLKDTLQWDPAIDVLLNRLPSRFIAPPLPGGRAAAASATPDPEAAVGALATGLDANDAFVIFPEGGNFTPSRRRRGIDRLRNLGLSKMAARAEAMRHVLAPRPGGVLAALDAAPDADVVMVAHTGLDHLVTVRDIWRELPMDKAITMRWWLEPASAIPAGRNERIDWLYKWWERIDTWIGDQARSR
jgi:hypothetical protein